MSLDSGMHICIFKLYQRTKVSFCCKMIFLEMDCVRYALLCNSCLFQPDFSTCLFFSMTSLGSLLRGFLTPPAQKKGPEIQLSKYMCDLTTHEGQQRPLGGRLEETVMGPSTCSQSLATLLGALIFEPSRIKCFRRMEASTIQGVIAWLSYSVTLKENVRVVVVLYLRFCFIHFGGRRRLGDFFEILSEQRANRYRSSQMLITRSGNMFVFECI